MLDFRNRWAVTLIAIIWMQKSKCRCIAVQSYIKYQSISNLMSDKNVNYDESQLMTSIILYTKNCFLLFIKKFLFFLKPDKFPPLCTDLFRMRNTVQGIVIGNKVRRNIIKYRRSVNCFFSPYLAAAVVVAVFK